VPRTVCLYDDLNLNDGVSYFLLPGFDPGAPVLDFDEHLGWGGSVVQANVTEAALVAMTVPLRIEGTGLADLDDKVAALNQKIAGGAQTLTHGPTGATTAYSCVRSRKVAYVRDRLAQVAGIAFVTFNPLRLP
jgi:hypothetical protein